jgi:hypothetical protein
MPYRLILLFALVNFTSFSQGISTIRGNIMGADSGNVLSMVIIDMQYGGYASSSNVKGDFVFQFPTVVIDSEKITFSKIGYQSKLFLGKELMMNGINYIKLKKAEKIEIKLGLSEARTLVTAAVDSIQANYISASFFQNGFFQESANITNIGYVKLKEALIRVERYPEDKELDRIKVIKSRYLDWKGQSAKLEAWQFGNGPMVVSRSIETELPDFLNKRSLKNYDFKVDSLMESYNNLALYVVNFEPKSNGLRGGRVGKIYIEPESKAIVRLVYELTPKGLKDVIGSGSSNVKLEGESLKYISQYRWSVDKWVLHQNSVTVNLSYKEKLDSRFNANVVWQLDFVATESRRLESRMIKEIEVLTSTETFRPAAGLGIGFWENQNFIMPNEEMQKLPQNLRKR